MQILYTTTTAIRSVLGLDDNDLPDEIIDSCNFADLMEERLLDVRPDHELACQDEGVARRLRLWAQYYCALALIKDAPLGIPAKMQANTDVMQRFDVDFVNLQKNLESRVASFEKALLPACKVKAEPAALKLMGKATPSYNPITGGTS